MDPSTKYASVTHPYRDICRGHQDDWLRGVQAAVFSGRRRRHGTKTEEPNVSPAPSLPRGLSWHRQPVFMMNTAVEVGLDEWMNAE